MHKSVHLYWNKPLDAAERQQRSYTILNMCVTSKNLDVGLGWTSYFWLSLQIDAVIAIGNLFEFLCASFLFKTKNRTEKGDY